MAHDHSAHSHHHHHAGSATTLPAGTLPAAVAVTLAFVVAEALAG